jgi:hypothetical protein
MLMGVETSILTEALRSPGMHLGFFTTPSITQKGEHQNR